VRVFFTADTHFGHGGARGLYRRPFASTAEMDAAMEARWNATVGPDDEVWHLGDVALGPKGPALEALLARLHGRKHLVAGNNDPEAVRRLACWASVRDYAELELEGTGLVLNLHGHSHGRLQPLPRQADVGVDARGFRPVALAEILSRPPRGRAAPDR
jgi:calcineurin-like phosphoesterase family protein